MWVQISKYKYNNNKNIDEIAWNRNELAICGVTSPVVKLLKKKSNTALAKTTSAKIHNSLPWEYYTWRRVEYL